MQWEYLESEECEWKCVRDDSGEKMNDILILKKKPVCAQPQLKSGVFEVE